MTPWLRFHSYAENKISSDVAQNQKNPVLCCFAHNNGLIKLSQANMPDHSDLDTTNLKNDLSATKLSSLKTQCQNVWHSISKFT